MINSVFGKSDNFKSEYSCAVVEVGELSPIDGSDFLAKTDVFGTQIVVRRDQVKTGDIMLYAANETQLNEKFLSVNNLYELSLRDKNSNADELNKIMEGYEPFRKKAEVLKSEAKQVKSSIEQLTKKSNKLSKEVAKKIKQLDNFDESSEEYKTLSEEIKAKKEKSEEFLKKAMSKTTAYTNLKTEIKNLVDEGKVFVDEANKKCGFFNKYGRVRCITLKGTPSFGFLFSPEEIMKFDGSITMSDIVSYLGQEFDTVNGELFVKAFVPPLPPENIKSNKNRAQKRVNEFDRMIEGEFFFHYNTEQLQKNISLINPEDIVDISVKKHGTSLIVGKLHVKNRIKLPVYKSAWNKFIDYTGLFKKHRITDYSVGYGPVYSSRTVIKNRYINDRVGDGFYGYDIWSEYGEIIYPYLEEGMTVYGEICGYLTGSESQIQKTYDYGCDKGENNVMFYRITTTNDDGSKLEWNVQDVLEWTEGLIKRMKSENNENWKRISPINLLYHGTLEDLYPEIDTSSHWHENVLKAMENDKEHFGMEENEPLCTFNEVPREGICLRKFNDKRPECWKLKTQSFMLGEAVRMDAGEVDAEMSEGYGT